jgi:asparagine synthase (glutamine-hydrolysing)
MSVQFGRWNLNGEPVTPEYLEPIMETLAPFGPDGAGACAKDGLAVLYRAFCTTKESRYEKQPHVSASGAVITWDGRLDNRPELLRELGLSSSPTSTDVVLVACAYEKWGHACLPKLIGDWALSIWDPRTQSLLLAKDFAGSRHLYYSFDDKQISWSTILDALVLHAGRTFKICEEYLAGWLAVYPAAHLTPYVGIRAVPPCSSVVLKPGKHGVSCVINAYWDFDAAKRIRYRSDAEYEEHFRDAFGAAIRRNLRSDTPVLADLSGGMDSSSIVCMADAVLVRGQAECPRLDTISWYDDSYDHLEPDTNELHWVVKVEEKRGRAGFHFNPNKLAANKETLEQKQFASAFDSNRFGAVPIPNSCLGELFEQYSAHMRSHGHRVTLCGVGGSEFLGDGVPSPKLELQNYLTRLRFPTLARQLNAWAAKMRKPRFPILWEAIRGFFPLAFQNAPEDIEPPAPWLHPAFVRRNRAALRGYSSRTKFFGALPSFQDNLHVLDGDRMLLARSALQPAFLREVRLPYLDRDLLEFIFAIPREQIVRVGQRRSLMKRALVGIVPDELLNRRRKPFPSLGPGKTSSPAWPSFSEVGQPMVCADLGIIDVPKFREALQKARGNEPVHSAGLTQILTIESWLRHLTVHGVLPAPWPAQTHTRPARLKARELHVPLGPKV